LRYNGGPQLGKGGLSVQIPDSETLRQGAAGYHIYGSLFDLIVMTAILTIITIVRYFVGKKPNSNPSRFWYVPKIVGMLFILIFGCAHFMAEGAFVEKVSGSPAWLVFMTGAALAVLYWAYRVIWKPIVPKAVY
jgi:protein-S-isoprenylcysteine O-methyltransferase Ste14